MTNTGAIHANKVAFATDVSIIPWCQAAWSIPKNIPGKIKAIYFVLIVSLNSENLILNRTKIIGIASADLQKAVEIGPVSLSLTKIGLTPKQLAPIMRITATNQTEGFSILVFKEKLIDKN